MGVLISCGSVSHINKERNLKKDIKKLLLKSSGFLIIAVIFINCGAGDNTSISVQPSQEIFDQLTPIEVKRFASMDILWVVDNSSSMKIYQDKIRVEFDKFIKNFTEQDSNDFQIGVTTTSAYEHLDLTVEDDLLVNDGKYVDWNNKGNGFKDRDKPCTETITTDCYDYKGDEENRFKPETRCSELINRDCSDLIFADCDVCNGPDGEPGMGREISILSNSLLDELRLICDDESENANGKCETCNTKSSSGAGCAGELRDPATGREKFIDLFDWMIVKAGTRGNLNERAFQSIQATRLNPKNAELFRDSAHLAIIIVSDAEDDSRPNETLKSNHKGICVFTDELGILQCSNMYSPSYYKDFLEKVSNDVLGVSVHNIGLNPKDGYKNYLPVEIVPDDSGLVKERVYSPEYSPDLDNAVGGLDLLNWKISSTGNRGYFDSDILEKYKSGMNDDYSDNDVTGNSDVTGYRTATSNKLPSGAGTTNEYWERNNFLSAELQK